jgi:hypothetical protein
MLCAAEIDIFAGDPQSESESYDSDWGGSSDGSDAGVGALCWQKAEILLQAWQLRVLGPSKSIKLTYHAYPESPRLIVEGRTIEEIHGDSTMRLTLKMSSEDKRIPVFGSVSNFDLDWSLEEFEANVRILQGVHEAIPPQTLKKACYEATLEKERLEAESEGRDLDAEYKATGMRYLEHAINTHGSHLALRTLAGLQKLKVHVLEAQPCIPEIGPPRLRCAFIAMTRPKHGGLRQEYAGTVEVDKEDGSVLHHTLEWLPVEQCARQPAAKASTVSAKAENVGPKRASPPGAVGVGGPSAAVCASAAAKNTGRKRALSPGAVAAGGSSAAANAPAPPKRPKTCHVRTEDGWKAEYEIEADIPCLTMDQKMLHDMSLEAKNTGGKRALSPGAVPAGSSSAAANALALGKRPKTWHVRTDDGWDAQYEIEEDIPRLTMDPEMLHDDMSLTGVYAFLKSEPGRAFCAKYAIPTSLSQEELGFWFLFLNAKEAWLRKHNGMQSTIKAGLEIPLYCTFCKNCDKCDCHDPEDAAKSQETLRENVRKWFESKAFKSACLNRQMRERISEFVRA